MWERKSPHRKGEARIPNHDLYAVRWTCQQNRSYIMPPIPSLRSWKLKKKKKKKKKIMVLFNKILIIIEPDWMTDFQNKCAECVEDINNLNVQKTRGQSQSEMNESLILSVNLFLFHGRELYVNVTTYGLFNHETHRVPWKLIVSRNWKQTDRLALSFRNLQWFCFECFSAGGGNGLTTWCVMFTAVCSQSIHGHCCFSHHAQSDTRSSKLAGVDLIHQRGASSHLLVTKPWPCCSWNGLWSRKGHFLYTFVWMKS